MLDRFLQVLVEGEKKASVVDEMTELLKKMPLEEIQKIASGETKLAFDDGPTCACDEKPKTWLQGYEGTPLYDQAVALEEEYLKLEAQDIERRMNRENDSTYEQKDLLRLKKKLLDLDLERAKNGVGSPAPEELEPEAPELPPPTQAKAAEAFNAALAKEAQMPPMYGVGGAVSPAMFAGPMTPEMMQYYAQMGMDPSMMGQPGMMGGMGMNPMMQQQMMLQQGMPMGMPGSYPPGAYPMGMDPYMKMGSAEQEKTAESPLMYGGVGALAGLPVAGPVGMAGGGLGGYYGAKKGAPVGRAGEAAIKGGLGATAGAAGGSLLGALGGGLGGIGLTALAEQLGMSPEALAPYLIGGGLAGGAGLGGLLGGKAGYSMMTEGLDQPDYQYIMQHQGEPMERTASVDPVQLAKLAKELTQEGREHIKSKNFAIPKGNGPGDTGKYPIHDEAHARNALVRVRQHGTSEEKAKVYAAVAKKYPGLAGRSSIPAVEKKAKESCSKTAQSFLVDRYLQKLAEKAEEREKPKNQQSQEEVDTKWRPPRLPTPNYIDDADIYTKRLVNRAIHNVLKGVKKTETNVREGVRKVIGGDKTSSVVGTCPKG